jgi:hypothetical protein
MFDTRTQKLVTYIETQISQVSGLDAAANKKGSDKAKAEAHQKGFLEAMNAVKTVMYQRMQG